MGANSQIFSIKSKAEISLNDLVVVMTTTRVASVHGTTVWTLYRSIYVSKNQVDAFVGDHDGRGMRVSTTANEILNIFCQLTGSLALCLVYQRDSPK